MSKKKTIEQFINQANIIHNNKYDYSKSIYLGDAKKIEIVCNTHGSFWQTPSNHLRKNNCPKCAGNYPLTLDDFIKKSNYKHNNLYDYSKIKEFVGCKSLLNIICNLHGEFWQTAHAHMHGAGCQKCGGSSRVTLEDYIIRAKNIHGNEYIYDKVILKNMQTKIIITCRVHGDFEVYPHSHLSGHKCLKCSHVFPHTTDSFINLAQKIHGSNTYFYKKTIYKRAKDKVIITCPDHGDFLQKANNHLTGKGCRLCSSSSNEQLVAKTLDELNIKHFKK